jgi:hypothetical protein
MSDEVLAIILCEHGRLGPHMVDDETWCKGWERRVRLEPAWECLFPEFADEKCLYDHDPAATLMPRKHDGCGWNLLREVTGDER